MRGYTTAYLVYPNGQLWGPCAGVTLTAPPVITQGNNPWSMSPIDGQAGPVMGEPDLFGAFWNRTLLFFDPIPSSWTNIVNPPTSSSAPTLTEIQQIRTLLARWGAGHAAKIGIAAIVGTSGGLGRACFGYPYRTFTSQAGMTFGGTTGQAGTIVFTASP